MPNELNDVCVACRTPGQDAAHYVADEIMTQSGETFTYRECASCGTLQIETVPDDLGRYYDNETYSSFTFHDSRLSSPLVQNPLSRLALKGAGALHRRTGKGIGLGWIHEAGIQARESVLDLGSGAGENLVFMQLFGHRSLTGSDPFLDRDLDVQGIPIRKARHEQLTGLYDWVTMHHSFEHVPDPEAMLASATRLLAPGGRILIRMPVMGTYAWKKYGRNWSQIDAPRHLVVYTQDAVRQIADRAGLVVEKIFFDSWSFLFWGSELAAQGLPHQGASMEQARAHFSKEQLAKWQAMAVELNKAGDGDAGGYVLRRKDG